jgi:undecaprenyl-diphosphatase
MNTLIILTAKYLFLISFVIAGIFFMKETGEIRKKMTIIGILSGAISLLLLKVTSLVINDPRPFVVNHISPLIPHIADNGFPSDHTLLTMWIALVVFIFNRRIGFILMAISVIVGVSRIFALIHHPIDIIGSIVIAAIAVYLSNVVYNKLPLSLK